MPEIRQALSEEEFSEAKRLLQEYADWLNYDFCYRNIGKEIDEFPGEYGPPGGKFFLAYVGDKVAASVAVRRWEGNVCEMKRLFVRPEFRGKGIGKKLAKLIIDEAGKMGYRSMRLDTLPNMTEAIELYKSLGFQEVDKYRESPTDDAFYFELKLV